MQYWNPTKGLNVLYELKPLTTMTRKELLAYRENDDITVIESHDVTPKQTS